MIVHTDCRYFRGDVPCQPHKQSGVHCDGCNHYDRIDGHILIIKMGAVGDVIRTTPLLHKIRACHPRMAIHWLTHYPDILPETVDRSYTYTLADVETLKSIDFDLCLSLDKDPEAAALAMVIHAKEKKGFGLEQGRCIPLSDTAESKWLTGLFDDLNRENRLSYPEEIFAICGWTYNGEAYLLPEPPKREWELPDGSAVVGLNTGCGRRWTTRLWPDEHWIRLAERIIEGGGTALFLGGPEEHSKNEQLAGRSGGVYLGTFKLPDFISLMNRCDVVVTSVTMALHIALGLKKFVVLFNNIFNAHEFELFGRGVILQPPVPCTGCFRQECQEPCMELIKPDEVYVELSEWMNRKGEEDEAGSS